MLMEDLFYECYDLLYYRALTEANAKQVKLRQASQSIQKKYFFLLLLMVNDHIVDKKNGL